MPLLIALCFFLLAGCSLSKQSPNQAPLEILQYDRTPCYGFCPVYQVKLWENGQGLFIGRQYVSIMDSLSFTLPDSSLAAIQKIRQSETYQKLSVGPPNDLIMDAAGLRFQDIPQSKNYLFRGERPDIIQSVVSTIDQYLTHIEYLPGRDSTALIQEEIIIQLTTNQPLTKLNGNHRTYSLAYLKSLSKDLALYRIFVPKNQLAPALSEIRNKPEVVAAQFNHRLQPR